MATYDDNTDDDDDDNDDKNHHSEDMDDVIRPGVELIVNKGVARVVSLLNIGVINYITGDGDGGFEIFYFVRATGRHKQNLTRFQYQAEWRKAFQSGGFNVKDRVKPIKVSWPQTIGMTGIKKGPFFLSTMECHPKT